MKPFLLMCVLAAGWSAFAGQVDVPLDVSDSPAAVAEGFRPVDYFQQSCASCHGPYGSFYGDAFGQGLEDAALTDIVADMAAGPAGSPLEGEALASLVAYHRSLIDGRPFIAVVSRGDGQIVGETTPEARVLLGDRRAKVLGHTFTAVPSGFAGPIVAERDGRRTVLEAGQAFSHHEPVQPGAQ